MKKYWAILNARFQVLLQYRTAAIAGLATQLFWGFMRVMIFSAFYRSSNLIQPMSLTETISYIWLGQALLLLLPWWIDRDLAQLVRSGNVAYELLKPVDLYWMWYARAVAVRIAPTMLRSLPMFILAFLFFGLQPPASVAAGFWFILTIIGSLLVGAALTVLLNISILWTVTGDGIYRITLAMVWIFSGIIIPLPFYPDWAQPVLNFLPFRDFIDIPFRLYIGRLPVQDGPLLLLHQLAWAAVLVIAGRAVISAGKRKLVIQGG